MMIPKQRPMTPMIIPAFAIPLLSVFFFIPITPKIMARTEQIGPTTVYHDLTFFDNFFLLIIMYKNIENTKIAKLIIWDVEKGPIPPLS